MIWAIVPAKTLEQAKTRLARVLSPEERSALSLAMLRDLLSALHGAQHLDGVAVVTADAALEAAAREAGAQIVAEQTIGQNVALQTGVAYAHAQGATEVLVISADLPLLCSATIDHLIERAQQSNQSNLVLLAPSREGTGTNAMLQRPPGVIPFLFGLNSLQRHQQAADERGVPVELVQAQGLAFDIDLPADLLELASSPGQTRTQAALAQMGIVQRLQESFYREISVT
jgi:2-phospho-L-lactate guanylyltransferase